MFFAALLVGVAVEFLTPGIPLSGFLLIPVLASIALGRPVLTAALAITALALAVPVQLWLDYDRQLVIVRSGLIGASGIVAVALAAALARTMRGRTELLATSRVKRNGYLTSQLQRQTDRMAAELANAASYMATIMPSGLDGAVSVSSCYLPSQELAGDSFDYRWIDDDHLIAYLIDVSGHGIEPALLSVSVHNLLRSGSMPLPTLLAPDTVLAELNRLFQMDQHGDHYLTMWFGVYEASSRTLRYASAGAPPAFAATPDDASATTELATDGQPIGMFDDTTYTTSSYTVPPGCRILLFSDGAYEDAHVDGRQMSLTDFRNLYTRLDGSSLDDLVDTLKGLTPSGSFGDDCSLVRMEFD